MRAAAAIAACAALAVWVAPRARADREGRVVRVERKRLAAAEVRMCPLTEREGKLTCYGGARPPRGTEYVLVGLDGVRGRARAGRVEPNDTEDPCGLGTAHDVHLEAGGAFDTSPLKSGYVVGVQGLEVERGASLVFEEFDVSPSGRPDESVWIALDRDGDGAADLAASGRPCPEEQARVPASAAGRKVQAYCISYWLRSDREWSQVGAHVYYRCR